MIHILFLILKIIGWILLFLLVILLLLILMDSVFYSLLFLFLLFYFKFIADTVDTFNIIRQIGKNF